MEIKETQQLNATCDPGFQEVAEQDIVGVTGKICTQIVSYIRYSMLHVQILIII